MIMFILQVIIGFMFLSVGTLKLIITRPQIISKMGAWAEDFTIYQIKFIGFIELLGSTLIIHRLLLTPFYVSLEIIGLTLLTLVMIGATYTHLKRKEAYLHTMALGLTTILLLIFKIL